MTTYDIAIDGWKHMKHMKTYETDMNIHVGFDMVC